MVQAIPISLIPLKREFFALIRVLVVSSLYPNPTQPNHGVFVENRLRRTLALGDIEATVVAPVPFFPFAHPLFGTWAKHAKTPHSETRHDLEVRHPRHLVIPKLGAALTPRFLFETLKREVNSLRAAGKDFDVIDAHYFYPDGVAAAMLARELGLPLMITGRGTDLTLIPNFRSERAQIKMAIAQADVLITVCEDLRQRLLSLGAPREKTITLRNGVDLEAFTPQDQGSARLTYGVDGFTLVSVGGLIERKGHDLIIRALPLLPDCRLLIAGDGPLKSELGELAQKLGVGARVKLLGPVPHHALSTLYSAADIMVLASSREGWANVLLESMACGVPVVATNVNGTSEVVRSQTAGLLVNDRTPEALAKAIMTLRQNLPPRSMVRTYAEAFSWDSTVKANKTLLETIAHAPREASGAAARVAIQNLTTPEALSSATNQG